MLDPARQRRAEGSGRVLRVWSPIRSGPQVADEKLAAERTPDVLCAAPPLVEAREGVIPSALHERLLVEPRGADAPPAATPCAARAEVNGAA